MVKPLSQKNTSHTEQKGYLIEVQPMSNKPKSGIELHKKITKYMYSPEDKDELYILLARYGIWSRLKLALDKREGPLSEGEKETRAKVNGRLKTLNEELTTLGGYYQ